MGFCPSPVGEGSPPPTPEWDSLRFSGSSVLANAFKVSPAYLVIIILRGASAIKPQVQAAGPWNVHGLFKFIVVPDRVNSLHSLPGSPRSWDFQAGEETRLFFLFQHSGAANKKKRD